MTGVVCDYCGNPAELVGGAVIYPHRPDLGHLKFWLCAPCGAWTGTHSNSADHKPKGRLANAELRAARIQAHTAFDPIWQRGGLRRGEAYRWLRDQLALDAQPHIGFMDAEQCRRVVEVCREAAL